MSIFRVAVAQINSIVGDLEYNTRKITDWISKARDMGADLVAFPEMAITGYPPEDLLLKPSFLADNMTAMKQVISMSHDIAVVVGFADIEGTHRYNAAAFAYNGDLIHAYHKMYLPNYGVFDEDRYFNRGNISPVYLLGTTSVAVNICEDIWYPEGPTTFQANSGADIIVNINASPFDVGKLEQRRRMLTKRAANNKVHIVYVNMIGGQDELVFDGGSMVFKDNGDLLLSGKQFQEELIVADIEFSETNYRSLEYKKHETFSEINTSTIVVPEYYRNEAKPPIVRKNIPQLDKLEEIYSALVLGTADYVRKNLFESVVIGLSGGIDSSLTACIAVDAIGPEKVIGIAMPSRYSSDGSLDDSKELANNLGIRFLTIPIELAHAAYQEMLSSYFPDLNVGVADENIQARVRGNILMATSNIMGSLVLTTANKSETALGYSTLYGDMAGGFAVIKDIPKTLVYELSMWRDSKDGTDSLIPGQIFTKAPSAELRPGQKDQDTLPPYDLLDKIIKAYVEDECGFHEILKLGFVPDVVKSVLFSIDKNEYKRRQAPPGIKITSRAFGKDRRLPIVNRYRQF